jgi:hypothetical protein
LSGSGHYIKALDLVREGHWDESHKVVQPYSDELSCLIHAYLHRVEGDQGNARYWYGRAGDKMPNNSLADEMNRLYRLANA